MSSGIALTLLVVANCAENCRVSTVRQWIHVLRQFLGAFGVFHAFSVKRNSDLEVVFVLLSGVVV